MKKFSEFAQESSVIIGDKIKIDDVLGKEIIIKGYSLWDSKYQKSKDDKVLTLQFTLDGEDRILFTGSAVLIDQIEKYKDEIPFITKIEKVNKYYTFS